MSRNASPTIKIRLLPLFTVCDQVRVETLVAVMQLELSLPPLPWAVTSVMTLASTAEPLLFEASGS